jgi:hypothetical protein
MDVQKRYSTFSKGMTCYALCTEVKPFIFSDKRCIIIGDSKDFLLVDKRNLRRTRAKEVVAEFYIEKILSGRGYARGIVANCVDGAPSGRRNILIDSLTRKEDVLDF